MKYKAGWITSWNQDFQEKYQQPYIGRWFHSNGRNWRGTKEPLDVGERGSEKAGLNISIQKTKIRASTPTTSWQTDGGKVETVLDFIFLGSRITADGDCSHEIKRHLLLGRKFSSVESCPILCDPMDCSMPGFPVPHQLQEFTQTHVHCGSDGSNHLILCHPLLLPPSIFPSIRVFSNVLVLRIRCPKYWSFSFSISPSNEYSGLISSGLISLQSNGLSRVFSSVTIPKHQFFGAESSLWSLTSVHDYWKNHSFD